MKRSHHFKAVLKSSLVNSSQWSPLRFQGLRIILFLLVRLSAVLVLLSGLWVILPFPWEVADVCSYIVSSTCFLLLGSCRSSCLFWFCSLFLPLIQVGIYFVQNNLPQNLVGLVWIALGFSPLDRNYTHRSIWDNPFSLSGSRWDGWGTKERRCSLSGLVEKTCEA